MSLHHRNTPHRMTGDKSSFLLTERKIQTKLPSITKKTNGATEIQTKDEAKKEKEKYVVLKDKNSMQHRRNSSQIKFYQENPIQKKKSTVMVAGTSKRNS